jgi:hypothetical protein
MKVFTYKDREYIRVIPVKKLFNSTMIHEVVNRGDIFAIDLITQELTIIPGKAEVEFTDCTVVDSTYLATLQCATGEL